MNYGMKLNEVVLNPRRLMTENRGVDAFRLGDLVQGAKWLTPLPLCLYTHASGVFSIHLLLVSRVSETRDPLG